MANAMYHWEIMMQMDPELNEKTTAWRSQICATGAIPKKYVELIRVAMAASMRSVPTQRSHIQRQSSLARPRKRFLKCFLWS